MMKTALATLTLLTLALPTWAGSLDAPAAPAAGSGMPSTADIYNRLDTGAAVIVPGSFQEPAAGPTAGTGRTLADIAAKLPAPDNTHGAAAGDVANGKTFWGLRTDGTWGVTSGTQAAPASGANVTGANGQLTFAIPDGLYSGGKTATAADGNLQPGNIKSGVTIFGVSGSASVVNASHVSRITCIQGWGGAGCDVCAGQWSGASCNVCPSGWSGVNCDIISKPFTGGTVPSYSSMPWKCVTDTATGLTWEVKTADEGLHDQGNTYSWYDSTAANPGTANRGRCNGSGCDTEKFVAAVNTEQLCGYSNWRMPSLSELQGLVVSGVSPSIDSAYFPNMDSLFYWSGSSYAPNPSDAWFVVFDAGYTLFLNKTNSLSVRLVRSGQ